MKSNHHRDTNNNNTIRTVSPVPKTPQKARADHDDQYQIPLLEQDVDRLNRHCSEEGILPADFIADAVRRALPKYHTRNTDTSIDGNRVLQMDLGEPEIRELAGRLNTNYCKAVAAETLIKSIIAAIDGDCEISADDTLGFANLEHSLRLSEEARELETLFRRWRKSQPQSIHILKS